MIDKTPNALYGRDLADRWPWRSARSIFIRSGKSRGVHDHVFDQSVHLQRGAVDHPADVLRTGRTVVFLPCGRYSDIYHCPLFYQADVPDAE